MIIIFYLIQAASFRHVTLSGGTAIAVDRVVSLGTSLIIDSSQPAYISIHIDIVPGIGDNTCFFDVFDYLTQPKGPCVVEGFSDELSPTLSLLRWRPPQFWTGGTSIPVNVSVIDHLTFHVTSTYSLSIPVSVTETQACTAKWLGSNLISSTSTTPDIPINWTAAVTTDHACALTFFVAVEPSTAGVAKICDSKNCNFSLVTNEHSITVNFVASAGFYGTAVLSLTNQDTINHYLEISSEPQALTLVDLCPGEKRGIFPGCVKLFGCLSLTGDTGKFYFAKLSFPGTISVSDSVSESVSAMIVEGGVVLQAPLRGLREALQNIKVEDSGDLTVQVWEAKNIHDNWNPAFVDDFPLAQLIVPIFKTNNLLPDLFVDFLHRAEVFPPNATSTMNGIRIINTVGKEASIATVSIDSLDDQVSLHFMGQVGQHISVNATISEIQRSFDAGQLEITPTLSYQGRTAVRLMLTHEDVEGTCQRAESPTADSCVCVSPVSAGVVCNMNAANISHQATVSVLIHK